MAFQTVVAVVWGERPGEEGRDTVPDALEEGLDGGPDGIPVRSEQAKEGIRHALEGVQHRGEGTLDELPHPGEDLLHAVPSALPVAGEHTDKNRQQAGERVQPFAAGLWRRDALDG